MSTTQERRVTGFSVSQTAAIQALVDLSRTAKAPLGIVLEDDRLCTTKVKYSGTDVPLASALDSIVAQVPGYGWSRAQDSPVLLVAPLTIRPVTARFLGLVDERYGPDRTICKC